MKKFYRTSLGFSWGSRLKRIFKRSEPLIVATESKYFREKFSESFEYWLFCVHFVPVCHGWEKRRRRQGKKRKGNVNGRPMRVKRRLSSNVIAVLNRTVKKVDPLHLKLSVVNGWSKSAVWIDPARQGCSTHLLQMGYGCHTIDELPN
jgi:hypothetical protein